MKIKLLSIGKVTQTLNLKLNQGYSRRPSIFCPRLGLNYSSSQYVPKSCLKSESAIRARDWNDLERPGLIILTQSRLNIKNRWRSLEMRSLYRIKLFRCLILICNYNKTLLFMFGHSRDKLSRYRISPYLRNISSDKYVSSVYFFLRAKVT